MNLDSWSFFDNFRVLSPLPILISIRRLLARFASPFALFLNFRFRWRCQLHGNVISGGKRRLGGHQLQTEN